MLIIIHVVDLPYLKARYNEYSSLKSRKLSSLWNSKKNSTSARHKINLVHFVWGTFKWGENKSSFKMGLIEIWFN